MNIDEFRDGLDKLFDLNKITEVETYLSDGLTEAIQQDDTAAVVFILNEMVGYYRVMCEYDKAVLFGTKALQILEGADEEGSIHYATTQLNLATALRAAGRHDEALAFYARVADSYETLLEPDAFEHASLYNNMSLALQELERWPEAMELQLKALDIAKRYPEKEYELAVTHTNLGNSMLAMVKYHMTATDEQIQTAGLKGIDILAVKEYPPQIVGHFEKAIDIINSHDGRGSHLGAALLGLADIKSVMGNDTEALGLYGRAMDETEANLGKVDFYYRAKQGYDACLGRVSHIISGQELGIDELIAIDSHLVSGMDICRAWYEQKVRPMLEKDYKDILEHLSVGLFGEGSDAYGYDDITSRDHDWGPGVIILMDRKEDYDHLAMRLEASLLGLMMDEKGNPVEFYGFLPDINSLKIRRRGVFLTEEYFKQMSEDQNHLSAAVNGEVFYDGSGMTTFIRNKLRNYYPDEVWIPMLKQEIALFSQNGQYNYRRMRQRGDVIMSDMLLDKAIENAMHIKYILRKRYTPHDKWLMRGIRDMGDSDFENLLIDVKNASRHVPISDVTDAAIRPVLDGLQNLAVYLENEMIEMGLIDRNAYYMEDVISWIKEN